VLAQVDRLRLVELAELRRFLGIEEHHLPPTTMPLDVRPRTTTTNAVPPGDPSDPDVARAMIEMAVKGFDTPAADGTWPYIEDGVLLADEIRARQKGAEVVSGLAAMGDRAQKVHELTSITFESETSAYVYFDIIVTLQNGRSRYPYQGRFVLQDGVWKMAAEYHLQVSSLACSSREPPASCVTGRYEAIGKTGG
jgi:hypothetical protein